MNREILFRGKRTDNGEWVEGLVARYNPKFDCANIVDDFESLVPVKTETVGQYTGLTNKNGKKIFEGDIVKHYNHCDIKEYSEDIGRVFYYTETCRFLRTSKLFPDDCPEIYSSCEYEVIGNIYDNPELIGGINNAKVEP